MPKLKVLSGQEIIAILQSFDFFIAGQKGSHVKMKRVMGGISQTLTVPNHKELDRGTVKAVYDQASRYISADKLREFFYTE
jgi:predicted RNA binding protein YcfA (HicA-like mRNA interferase family)